MGDEKFHGCGVFNGSRRKNMRRYRRIFPFLLNSVSGDLAIFLEKILPLIFVGWISFWLTVIISLKDNKHLAKTWGGGEYISASVLSGDYGSITHIQSQHCHRRQSINTPLLTGFLFFHFTFIFLNHGHHFQLLHFSFLVQSKLNLKLTTDVCPSIVTNCLPLKSFKYWWYIKTYLMKVT